MEPLAREALVSEEGASLLCRERWQRRFRHSRSLLRPLAGWSARALDGDDAGTELAVAYAGEAEEHTDREPIAQQSA